MANRPLLAVSACLLGKPVRYDGGHKMQPLLVNQWGPLFDVVAICPESAIGMGVPRPPIQLVRLRGQIEARGLDDHRFKVGAQLRQLAADFSQANPLLAGLVSKARSPSCGNNNTALHDSRGNVIDQTSGLFVAALMQQNALLPVIDEEDLQDYSQRECFVQQVYAYSRWLDMLQHRADMAGLQDFHRRHKYILLAHHEAAYRQLGKWVADGHRQDFQECQRHYVEQFMQALAMPASRGGHVNALLHMLGFLKTQIATSRKQAMLEAIEAYRLQQIPLQVPVYLFQQILNEYPNEYLQQQFYLEDLCRDI